MSQEPFQPRWANAEWLEEVRTWVTEQAARHHRAVTGPITQPHVRPWATAMRVPTDRDALWFKATVPTFAHESALTEALSRWTPGNTPEVLACRPERNWLLMAGGGVTLRSTYGTAPDLNRACEAAAVYASLQKALVPRVDAMLELGVPDCRLATFSAQYARLLDDSAILCVGEEECLTVEEVARLRDCLPFVEAICSELAALGIPETLQHDDLHSNNILVQGDRTIIFDWGDSSISHPFFSLVVLLRGAARDFNMQKDSREIRQIGDCFLNAWDLSLSPSEIERACALADALGRISRALTYQRLLRNMAEPHFTTYVSSVSGWLQEFLEAADPLH